MILLLCVNIVRENEMPVLFLIFIGPPEGLYLNQILSWLEWYLSQKNMLGYIVICDWRNLRFTPSPHITSVWCSKAPRIFGSRESTDCAIKRKSTGYKFFQKVWKEKSFPFFFFRGYVLTNFILFFHNTSLDNTNKIPSAGPKGTNYRAERRR